MGRDEDFISERARVQLMALGIPAVNHVRSTLAGLFPRECNISAAGLNAEDLARVLIHFAGQALFPVSSGTRPTLKKVKPGWHFCQVYRDFNQLVELVAPYMAEGLEQGEGCFWVMPDVVKPEVAAAAIARSVEDVDAYLASGQLEMMSHKDWYLDASGRFKTFDEIAAGLLKKQDQALARGFKFLRAAGDAGWVSGTQQSKDFIEYEMKVNVALRSTKVAAICTYRADVTADDFIAIVTAHQDAIATTRAS